MQIIEVANLKPGQSFPMPLFHLSGRKLLATHTTMSQLHLDALTRANIAQVFMAENARPVLEFAKAPPTMLLARELTLGAIAETDLMTPDGVVMVQQNDPIEEHHLVALRDSAIDYLIPRPPADAEAVRAILENLSRAVLSRIDAQIKRGEYLRAPESLDPLKNAIPKPVGLEILNLNGIQLLRRRLSSRLQPVFGMLETGKSPEMQALNGIADDLLDLMKSEPRQFSQLALMTQRRPDHLPDHAVSVAVLAMAIATHIGLSAEHVRHVILGALLFDVGMLAVPKRIRTSSGTLTPADRQRVRQHPIFTLSMMEQMSGLSAIPRIIGYQHHERLNGSGYPAAAAHDDISDFSRIVAVADVFAASTNPRAYKSEKLPYASMEELVRLAHTGIVDVRAVKALLAAIGLFPVGSYVLLSNNLNASVVGANPARVDRPLICALEHSGLPSGTLIDLSEPRYERLKIVKAIPAPFSLDAPHRRLYN